MTISKHKTRALAGFLLVLLVSLLFQSAFADDLQSPTVVDPTIEVILPSDEPDTTEIPIDPTKSPTTAPTAVPIPTEIPIESESPYQVTVTTPNGWSNAAKAAAVIEMLDPTRLGVQQLEYNTGGAWIDLTTEYTLATDGKVSVTITDNAMLTVRVTDPHGHAFEEAVEIRFFDREAPIVTAGIDAASLNVKAQDALSGVGGIQVNGMLFTTLTDGPLSVRIADVLSKYERLAVRAFDYAGNFSEPVTLDNPYYTPDAQPTTVPTATANPTNSLFPSIVTPVPFDQSAQVTATPTATAMPIVETEYITIGPGMPYQADGNSHTLDVLYSAATNKQFITMQTKSGNTFYLVIDYDKPIDEEAEMYETYFLNLVDERDLLALMDESEMPTATPQIVYATPEPTTVPVATTVPTQTEPPAKENNQSTAVLALVAILALGGVGAFLFLKNKNSNNNRRTPSDYSFEDDDEDDDNDSET